MAEPSADPPAPATAAAKPQPDATSTIRLVIRARIITEENPPTPVRQPARRRALLLVLGAVAVLTLSWIGIRLFRSESTVVPTAIERTRGAESQLAAPVPTPSEAAPVVSDEPLPELGTSTVEPLGTATVEADESASPIKEVIPDVPLSARQTNRGTVRVSVRVLVDQEGTVIATTPDDPGPSRYFERLALEASKNWRFAPVEAPVDAPMDAEAQRLMLLHFHFTREGTTARATPLQ
jgi:TonB family protein